MFGSQPVVRSPCKHLLIQITDKLQLALNDVNSLGITVFVNIEY